MQEFTVQIPAGLKLGACTDSQAVRYGAMAHTVLLEGTNGPLALATNGKTLSLTPIDYLPGKRSVDADGKETFAEPVKIEKPVLVPAKAVQGNGCARLVTVNGQVKITHLKRDRKVELMELPAQEGRFPRVNDIFPRLEGTIAVRLNAGLLADLASAINLENGPGNCVTLFVPKDNIQASKPVAVVGSLGIGLIMPTTPDTGDPQKYLDVFNQLPNKPITFESDPK